jgi:hypothetical protein
MTGAGDSGEIGPGKPRRQARRAHGELPSPQSLLALSLASCNAPAPYTRKFFRSASSPAKLRWRLAGGATTIRFA